jgi:mannose-6-phosphate isomerase-like protein (cupin superfamily)
MKRLTVDDLPDGGTPATLAAIAAGWGPVERGGISRYDGAGHRTHNEGRHTHTVPEIFTIVRGSGTIELDGAPAGRFRAGDILIMEPGEDHHLISDGTVPLVFTWMHLGPMAGSQA